MPATPPLPPGPRSVVPGALFWRVRKLGLLPFLVELAREHGDIVYFRSAGVRYCLVSDPAIIRQVVVTDNARFIKGPALRNARATLGDGLLTSEGDQHRRQRRMIAPAFHAQKVKAYAETFVAHAGRTADRWHEGETIDLAEEMTELTLRVVAKTLFDADLEEQVRQIGQDMSHIVTMFERARNPFAPILNRLPLASNRRYEAAMSRIDTMIAEMIAARHDQPAERNDLLSILLAARDVEGGMSHQQVRDEAVTLFMAGHETTANALAWTWLLLSQHEPVEAALHEELDRVLDDSLPSAEHVPQLPYTRAVIAESMRLYPPAWIIARQATDDYDIGPYRVPAGTVLLMSQYIVHQDGRWWSEPEQFRPGRWLEESPDRPKYAYFPFGGGERSCVGEPFAWLEAMMLLATLARRWRLRRADDAPINLFPTITLRPKDPVRMKVQHR